MTTRNKNSEKNGIAMMKKLTTTKSGQLMLRIGIFNGLGFIFGSFIQGEVDSGAFP